MTIKDIAREAECAVGTVSRVLNNHPDVSDQTREKVMAVVNKYGFVLNNTARRLKVQDSKTISVLVKGTSSILLNDLLGIIQKRMEELPYSISVTVLDEFDNEAKIASRVYYEQKPTGIIFLGGNPEESPEDLHKLQVPCVVITNDASASKCPFLSSVSTDDLAGARCITEWLIKNGHKKIGVIGGDLQSSGITRKRYRGFLDAMEAHNLPFDFEKSYVSARYSFEDSAKAAKELVEKNPKMTAIFTMADSMAIGACRQLSDMGISVPEKMSIVGYDGLPYADYYNPRLTTIRQDEVALAENGLDILLKNIERVVKAEHKLIPFTFVDGESVKKKVTGHSLRVAVC